MLRERALPAELAATLLPRCFHVETCGQILIVVAKELRFRARSAVLLAQLLERYPAHDRVVLDLTAVFSLDSFALAALLQLGSDRAIRLVGLRPMIRTLFGDLGVLLVLRPAASVLDAVAEWMTE